MSENTTAKKMWLAEFRYGKPNLASFTIKVETKRCIRPSDHTQVIGYARVGRQIRKDSPGLFDNKNSAMLYLYEKSEQYVQDARKELDEAYAVMAQLSDAVLAMGKLGGNFYS